MKICLVMITFFLGAQISAMANSDFSPNYLLPSSKLAALLSPPLAQTCVAKGERCIYHSDCCEHLSCSYDWNQATYTCQ